jgi:RNA-directed DNA polymerase
LAKLETQIHAGTYQPAPSSCFIVHRPKPREIFASHFRDRVVHHLVVSRLEALFEPTLCSASFACRKGKGTHGALQALQKSGRRLSQGGNLSLWVLKLDLARFFVTIDRELLTRLLLKKITDPMLRRLTQKLFTHDGRVGCRRVGTTKEFAEIPASKS